jgi:hypothetical protein
MKVVICDQHGGFSLSLAGEIAYLSRKGETPFFYANPRVNGRTDFDSFVRVDPQSDERHFTVYTLLEDVGDSPSSEKLNAARWFNDRGIPRNDSDLVAVVEELGRRANGTHARLKVVEIPDGVEFEIHEYDGLEWVAETHRVWS